MMKRCEAEKNMLRQALTKCDTGKSSLVLKLQDANKKAGEGIAMSSTS
jgi:hypothetical protein